MLSGPQALGVAVAVGEPGVGVRVTVRVALGLPHGWTITMDASSTHQPGAPVFRSLPMRKRNLTLCPLYGRRLTTTWPKAGYPALWSTQAERADNGLPLVAVITPV